MKDALNWKPEGKKPKKRWIDESNQNFRILDNPEDWKMIEMRNGGGCVYLSAAMGLNGLYKLEKKIFKNISISDHIFKSFFLMNT